MVGGQRSGGVLGHFTLRGESFLLVYTEQLTMEVSLGTGGWPGDHDSLFEGV